MENIYTKVVEKIKIHILCSITFFENRTVCEIMSINMVETEGPQMTSQYGAYALHAGKARLHARTLMHTRPGTHTHEHTRTHRPISNIYCFFPQQQWFRERPLLLRYTYIACLVKFVAVVS
jgi:hypothetical protein